MESWEESLDRARRATARSVSSSRARGADSSYYVGSTRSHAAQGASDASGSSDALSVSAAMALAKGALEGVTVKVIGEVSELSNKAGYKAVYFTVKDKSAALPCMMWNNRFRACGVDMTIGSLVELTGRFTLYAAKGRMNFDVFSIQLAGEGNLRVQVANLARKLAAEGLCDERRKRPVPENIQTVGLVTSPRGDAVHDVLRTLRRRWPMARVLVAGVPVEGANAPRELVRGIECVAAAGAEAVLLVRGGGSYEDLMPFNDEGLARAIAACPVPVVTGIGHEPDTSIADLVADVRASTPTGAAEAVSPVAAELSQALTQRARRLHDGLSHRLDGSRARIERMATRPVFTDPMYLIGQDAQTLDFLSERLSRALPGRVDANKAQVAALASRLARALPGSMSRARTELSALSGRIAAAGPRILQGDSSRVDALAKSLAAKGRSITPRFASEVGLAASRLNDLSPLSVIARGYSISRNEKREVVSRTEQAPVGSRLAVQVSDGELSCRVEAAHSNDKQESEVAK